MRRKRGGQGLMADGGVGWRLMTGDGRCLGLMRPMRSMRELRRFSANMQTDAGRGSRMRSTLRVIKKTIIDWRYSLISFPVRQSSSVFFTGNSDGSARDGHSRLPALPLLDHFSASPASSFHHAELFPPHPLPHILPLNAALPSRNPSFEFSHCTP